MLARRRIYTEDGKLKPGIYLHGNLEMDPDTDALLVNRCLTFKFPGQNLDVDELLSEYGGRLFSKAELQTLVNNGNLNTTIVNTVNTYNGKLLYSDKTIWPFTGMHNVGGNYQNPSYWGSLGAKASHGIMTVVSDTISYSGYLFYDIAQINGSTTSLNNNISKYSGANWTHIYTGMLFIVE